MLNIVSILVAIVAAILLIPGLIPILGWINWIMLPFGVVALILGMLSRRNEGRNIAIVILAIGVIRLWLGGGII